jgi:hypothetical protein
VTDIYDGADWTEMDSTNSRLRLSRVARLRRPLNFCAAAIASMTSRANAMSLA